MCTGSDVTTPPQEDPETPTIVIGADTVVAVDGRILEKPRDHEDALRMLRSLSGKQHRVITGVAIVTWGGCEGPAQEVTAFHEETRVTFSSLSEELIREYTDSGEGWDKAGAYAIQARGAMLVQGVAGDVLNAVGFPLNRFCRELTQVPPVRTGSEVSAGAGQPGGRRGTGSGVRGTGSDVSGTGSGGQGDRK
uniref:Uncharacterized protein n=1 Tax=Mus spicilegus TaxID=10103 RepID=A0A8C6G547_MUSSI